MIREMQPVTPENVAELSALLLDVAPRFTDFTAGYQLMWAADYDCRFGRLFSRPCLSAREPDGSRRFALLSSLTDGECADFLMRVCAEAGGEILFGALTQEEAMRYAALFPGDARIETLDAEADYLYTVESLRTLGGRRLAAKRNHRNAFLREHPDYEILPYTEETRAEALAFLSAFRATGEDDTPSAHAEGRAAERLLTLCPPALLHGILLRVGGETVGISVGEIRGDTLYMHVEKARHEVRGAYPMLVTEALSRLPSGVLYANREEDDGDEGLRRSKESYLPLVRLYKYTLTLLLK